MGQAAGIGTVLQIAMVVIGHLWPAAAAAGLFPIAGTLLGALTGWLAGRGQGIAPTGARAIRAGVAAAIAGAIGSLVSTALGDVPLANVVIAAGATFVAGAIAGALVRPAARARR